METDYEAWDMVIRRYLLGEATHEERTRIEERFFSESDFFAHILAFEDALIDEYVLGRMPERDRQVFEANLTASQRRNVEFSRELMAEIRKEKKQALRNERNRREHENDL